MKKSVKILIAVIPLIALIVISFSSCSIMTVNPDSIDKERNENENVIIYDGNKYSNISNGYRIKDFWFPIGKPEIKKEAYVGTEDEYEGKTNSNVYVYNEGKNLFIMEKYLFVENELYCIKDYQLPQINSDNKIDKIEIISSDNKNEITDKKSIKALQAEFRSLIKSSKYIIMNEEFFLPEEYQVKIKFSGINAYYLFGCILFEKSSNDAYLLIYTDSNGQYCKLNDEVADIIRKRNELSDY